MTGELRPSLAYLQAQLKRKSKGKMRINLSRAVSW
jgi:hypothetical protein